MYERISHAEWHERFKPTTDVMYENWPFGTDDEVDTTRLWTVVVSDEGWTIMSGSHLVNRVGWWITEEPHEFQYFVEDDDEDE